ncbi:hypothetical protein Bca52824_023179 [Brassica carinata]|uniref:K-box domain-containing protein n=1 Tax=Brassica carinata TaxID=52824 RepID=A0A8X8AVC9_BRACI|nr:hypothetical protein Bca52824_023179 [Brassica carinata]
MSFYDFGYSRLAGYSAATAEQQLLLCSSQDNGDVLWIDESMRSELERLHLAIERLKGKEIDRMSFSDLISLENQLNDSLHSVKDRKTQLLLNQVGRSRLQVKNKAPQIVSSSVLSLSYLSRSKTPPLKNRDD